MNRPCFHRDHRLKLSPVQSQKAAGANCLQSSPSSVIFPFSSSFQNERNNINNNKMKTKGNKFFFRLTLCPPPKKKVSESRRCVFNLHTANFCWCDVCLYKSKVNTIFFSFLKDTQLINGTPKDPPDALTYSTDEWRWMSLSGANVSTTTPREDISTWNGKENRKTRNFSFF